MKHRIQWSTGALLAGMIAAGCSTSPPASEVAAANTAIGNAGQAIDQAAADPHVAKYASSELDRANASLGQAKEAWNKKHDLALATHQAYLAQQRAALAQELATDRAAHEAVTVAAANRDHVVGLVMAERPAAAPSAAIPGQVQQALPGFAFGTAKLPPNAKPAIDAVASALKENPGRTVVIEGHTDNVGSAAYNQHLAQRRAEAVRAALVRDGVESGRITIRSQGEQNPVASNDTPAGRSENRRAEVIIPGMEATTAVGSSEGSTSATGSGGQSGQQSGQQGEQQRDQQRDQQKGQQGEQSEENERRDQ